MPWENVGSVSTGNMPHEEDWILWSLGLAKKYVLLVCGDPPPGSNLDVMWHEHDLGSYPSLGVWSEYESDWSYVSRCERALEVFDSAVSWSELKGLLQDNGEEDDDDHEEWGV